MKKITMMLVMTMFLVLNINGVSAKELPQRLIEDINKTWTITFSEPVDINSVSDETIYVRYDSNKIKFPVSYEFNEDYTKVIVIPSTSYPLGTAMDLVISDNLVSKNGNKLSEMVTLPFAVGNKDVPIIVEIHP